MRLLPITSRMVSTPDHKWSGVLRMNEVRSDGPQCRVAGAIAADSGEANARQQARGLATPA